MDMIDDEPLILVDEADAAIGTCGKLAAHRAGLRHRAVSVIVVDGEGRMLLQKRAAAKYHSGGLWTNTCCGHPRPGEEPEDAAVRRLREEMGFACRLRPLFIARYRSPVPPDLIEDEIVHVFGGHFAGTPSPDPGEVADWRRAGLGEIAADMLRAPERYSVWFRHYLATYRDALAAILPPQSLFAIPPDRDSAL